jgi:hypothetical protein
MTIATRSLAGEGQDEGNPPGPHPLCLVEESDWITANLVSFDLERPERTPRILGR